MKQEQEPSGEDLRELAEQAISDKREETGDEAQARELYDLPTESSAELADRQADEA